MYFELHGIRKMRILLFFVLLSSCNFKNELFLGEKFNAKKMLNFSEFMTLTDLNSTDTLIIKNAKIHNYCKDSGCWIAIGDDNYNITASIKENRFTIPLDLSFTNCDALVIVKKKQISDEVLKELPELQDKKNIEMEILGLRFYN
jgi:hypothetical protein